ncbi:beclin 1 [Nannochloropsis gaditana]|uniref:Beclin 1 n=1 Tax=Nannochloropsis gaditana TaxID=72520 RepID=W7TXP0_9STRA|nr:beclin 1 [Nannochloropsis gaditana]
MPSEGDGPEAHILHLREKLKAVEARRITLHRRRALVEKKRRRLQGLLDLWQSLNNSAAEALLDLSESHQATHGSELSAGARLEALTQLNVANDCFHVWHSGPFATMNGCSIGRLPAFAAVEWTDINAGLGQAILLLDTLVKQTGFRFRRLELVPFGSFSKILRSPCDLSDVETKLMPNSPRITASNAMSFYYDEANLAFFPRRNMNAALVAFLQCVEEFGSHVEGLDPTIRLPHRVQGNKIGGLPIVLTPGEEDTWNRALKYLLTDLKWLSAWSARHVLL